MKDVKKIEAKEKAPNYTKEQEAAIIAASPLDLESAKALADTMGKTYRSVIAKAKSLNCEYKSKPAPLKKPKGVTKNDLVGAIAGKTGANLIGLEKATTQALTRLCEALKITVKASG